MGRIIRRTVTVTITETWTIVWLPEDESQRQAPAVVQEQPKTEEAADEVLQTILVPVDPGKPSASEPTTALTPSTTIAPQTDGESTRPATGGRGRRTRRHRQVGNTQRK